MSFLVEVHQRFVDVFEFGCHEDTLTFGVVGLFEPAHRALVFLEMTGNVACFYKLVTKH